MKKRFSELFKKYHLRAEFDTLCSFGNALAEKGYLHETSIFSHWQNGTRVPSDRKVLLKLLEIFIERQAINSLDEANNFLASANYGDLTLKEINQLPLLFSSPTFLQISREFDASTGRENAMINNYRQI